MICGCINGGNCSYNAIAGSFANPLVLPCECIQNGTNMLCMVHCQFNF